MFDIEYKGGNAVVISSKKATIALDPNTDALGVKSPKVKGAIELLTEERFRLADPELVLTIDGPGEYEVADFAIRGVAAARFIDDAADIERRSTLYRVEQSDVAIAVIGNVAQQLSDEQLEALGVVDILIIPVGGGVTLDATSAAAIVRLVEPKIVIPIHFSDDGLKYEVPQESLDAFVKELAAPTEHVSKLKVKSSANLPAAMTVYVLDRV